MLPGWRVGSTSRTSPARILAAISFLPEDQVQRPATAGVRPRAAEVGKQGSGHHATTRTVRAVPQPCPGRTSFGNLPFPPAPRTSHLRRTPRLLKRIGQDGQGGPVAGVVDGAGEGTDAGGEPGVIGD